MIPAIILPRQLALHARVPHDPGKIHRRVERPALQNPVIHFHPRLIPRRIRVRLPVPTKWRNRRANRLDAGRVAVARDLLEGLLQAGADAVLRAGVGAARADVVDPFKNHDVLDAGDLQCVALVAGEERRAEAAGKDGVAARGLVVDGDVGEASFLEAREEEVGPAWGGLVYPTRVLEY